MICLVGPVGVSWSWNCVLRRPPKRRGLPAAILRPTDSSGHMERSSYVGNGFERGRHQRSLTRRPGMSSGHTTARGADTPRRLTVDTPYCFNIRSDTVGTDRQGGSSVPGARGAGMWCPRLLAWPHRSESGAGSAVRYEKSSTWAQLLRTVRVIGRRRVCSHVSDRAPWSGGVWGDGAAS